MLIAQRPIGNGEVKKSIDLLRNMMMYCTIDKYNSSIKVLCNMYYVHANSFFSTKNTKTTCHGLCSTYIWLYSSSICYFHRKAFVQIIYYGNHITATA